MPFVEIRNKKLLFVHIPKTGGGAIEDWLSTHSKLRLHTIGAPSFSKITPQHFTFNDINNIIGSDYFDYAFTVVRNPYDRLESEYRQDYIIEKNSFWKKSHSFPMWLENKTYEFNRDNFSRDNHLRPQIEFIGSNVDIFKYEQGLGSIIDIISKKLNIEYKEPREIHKPVGFDGKIEWDIHSRLLVNRLYHEDFLHFNYDKIFL